METNEYLEDNDYISRTRKLVPSAECIKGNSYYVVQKLVWTNKYRARWQVIGNSAATAEQAWENAWNKINYDLIKAFEA